MAEENKVTGTCQRCGAKQTESGDFIVHFGNPLSPKKIYARVCGLSLANSLPCLNNLNPTTEEKDSWQKQFGYRPI